MAEPKGAEGGIEGGGVAREEARGRGLLCLFIQITAKCKQQKISTHIKSFSYESDSRERCRCFDVAVADRHRHTQTVTCVCVCVQILEIHNNRKRAKQIARMADKSEKNLKTLK